MLRVLQEHQPLSLIALGDLLICESGSPSRLGNGLVEARQRQGSHRGHAPHRLSELYPGELAGEQAFITAVHARLQHPGR